MVQYQFGSGLIPVEPGLDPVLFCFGTGLVLVWFQFDASLDLVLFRFGTGLVPVWFRFGLGPSLIEAGGGQEVMRVSCVSAL